MEMQMKRLKRELQTAQLEMNKTASQYKEAQNQIEMLGKEKGKNKHFDTHSFKISKIHVHNLNSCCH